LQSHKESVHCYYGSKAGQKNCTKTAQGENRALKLSSVARNRPIRNLAVEPKRILGPIFYEFLVVNGEVRNGIIFSLMHTKR